MNLIIGSIIIFIGYLLVAKSEWMLNNFGRIAFFEDKLGTEGGSRLGYKIIGLICIFLGFLIFTGMISGFMTWLLSPLLRLNQPIN